MDVRNAYNSIPHDLSGAASKNRFRLEMLWGISKMFDLYDKPDFCVVFDYKCDVEIHFKDSLEFYQIKTHKVQKPYKFTVISKPDKNTGKSIIGRLYLLKNISDKHVNMKVALVSNAFFQIEKKVYSDVETLKFSDLDDATQKKICTALKSELQQDEVDISNVHYIYTSMNLLDPENDIKGKITGCFEKIKNCEPIKPNALYRLIRDTVDAKACYELRSDDYDELIANKGITKAQLDMMLDHYVDNTDNGVKQTQEYIEEKYSTKKRKKLKTALVHILEASVKSNELKGKEKEISSYIDNNIEDLSDDFEGIIDALVQKFSNSFSIEYTQEQIYVFLILVLNDGRMGKMRKMVFRKLYIFSSSEKKAKVVEFAAGKNIITSSPIDGTDRGKSVIMKSLYHALGADCYFDDKWQDDDKAYIVNFSIANEEYYIFRCNRLFKVFDSKKRLMFKTIDRRELAASLDAIFDFAVKLPNRTDDKLEITPPAYNYLLYFIDQDKLDGSNFASFEKLAQYPNYKENVLFYHFGAFDDTYYEIMHKLESLRDEIAHLQKEKELSESMLEKVFVSIKDVSYSKSIELLRHDIERSKQKYSSIAKTLSETRTKLIELRNEKDELQRSLHSLEHLGKLNENHISSLLIHRCPLCDSEVADTLNLRIMKYNTNDDIILLSSDLQISISQTDKKIAQLEAEYKDVLSKLSAYEESLGSKTAEVNDVLKHQGLIEVRDSITSDLMTAKQAIEEKEASEKELKKKIRLYNDRKKEINQRYYELMLADKIKFGLEEIDAKGFEKITNSFSAGGSNKPISTVIWYINLIKLKNQFNPNAINFPVVFDSPNNAETDKTKRVRVYEYLAKNIDDKNQLILSGIGFNTDDFDGVQFDKVIYLDNAKYELLSEEDYTNNSQILIELSKISD